MAIVGIDLGTTMSAIAHVDQHGQAVILKNDDGDDITPSVVYFESASNQVIGKHAKSEVALSPDLVVDTVKHFMGHDTAYEFHGQPWTPETISALILKKLVQDAEAQLGEKITGAVVTVPAIFGDSERSATKNAMQVAGLDVVGILEEPVAAAIAYGLDKANGTYLIYDLGGGTFDLTVLKINGKRVSMAATDGDRRLGGKDWDQELAQHMADAFKAEHGDDPMHDVATRNQLMQDAEEVKKALTKKETQRYRVTYKGKQTQGEITRAEFERISKPLLDQTEATTRQVIDELATKGELPGGFQGIDRVLLVGGSSRMPQVAKMVEALTGKTPETNSELQDQAVAQGAAHYAVNRVLEIVQVTGNRALEESLNLPTHIKQTLSEIQIDRVCSFAIGVDVLDGNRNSYNHVLVARNTRLPIFGEEQEFSTVADNQIVVDLPIYEGESPNLAHCRLLGEGRLELGPGLPEGSPIFVKVGLDEESLITVEARAGTQSRNVKFEIRREGGLSSDDIAVEAQRVSRLQVS